MDEVYSRAMEAPNVDFNLSRLERVMSGPGKVAGLGEELDRRGLKRAIVVTGKSLGASPLLAKVTGAAGARCAAVFKGARQHVPRSVVDELQREIERVDADCLISFGGGSSIDACKVASHAFLAKREIIQIAIPTTLSAGEYTYAGGVTDEKTLVKSGVSDPRLQPRTVINDPELTLGDARLVVGGDGHARAGSCHRNDLRDSASSAERRAGSESDRSVRGAFAPFDQN